jgi:oxygen-independent coproporphyrinogen-3 oxidase
MEAFIPDYCKNLVKEIQVYGEKYSSAFSIQSIYLGGGTPSYLPANSIVEVIQAVRESFSILPDVEISMEANPADINPQKGEQWRKAGVNRMSVGMQSADDRELKLLGRRHDFNAVCGAVDNLLEAGLENFNLDLMFGLPQQNLQSWQDSIRKALDLSPTHLSLYALTIEERTPLAADIEAAILSAPDNDLAADMYEWVMDYLPGHGFAQYEISNWAKEGKVDRRCKHNILYWRNQDYFGFGAAAHSHIGSQRWANEVNIPQYIKAGSIYSEYEKNDQSFPWVETFVQLSPSDAMGETAMMGLRLVQEGLRDDLFQEKYGKSLFSVYEKQIDDLIRLGLLEVVNDEVGAIRLTKHGKMVGNQVFMRFLLD